VPGRPTTLLAEVTHRCPLHCPYCSNPRALVSPDAELATGDWLRVFQEARQLGVLQLGLSGGEPLARPDLETLAGEAHRLGFYTTLVTSGVGLTPVRAAALRDAGLEHVQISIQDVEPEPADRVAGARVTSHKAAAAALVRQLGFAFTVNAVLHRDNLDRLEAIIELAASWGADRLELANTQYYGWGFDNRAALMPTAEQVARSEDIAARARERHRGRMQILYVLPDYYERYPKPCYAGWGQVYIVVTPDGRALPCHGATHLPDLAVDTVRERSLAWIWEESPSFTAFRGDAWMQEPCRSCERKALDFGGCRCQAFLLTGDASRTDPVCTLSPDRPVVDRAIEEAGHSEYLYRRLPVVR
jgi:PqqA peptide cyclase